MLETLLQSIDRLKPLIETTVRATRAEITADTSRGRTDGPGVRVERQRKIAGFKMKSAASTDFL